MFKQLGVKYKLSFEEKAIQFLFFSESQSGISTMLPVPLN